MKLPRLTAAQCLLRGTADSSAEAELRVLRKLNGGAAAILPMASVVLPPAQEPVAPNLDIEGIQSGHLSEAEIRKQAEAYWAYLMDYYDRWGYFPWDRHLHVRSGTYVPDSSAGRETAASFAYAFKSAAVALGVTIDWLEMMLTSPENTLLALGQETADSLFSKLQELRERLSRDITREQFDRMTLKELLELMLEAGIVTQSCGQTAGLVHGMLSPTTAGDSPSQTNAAGLAQAIRRADGLARLSDEPRYVRIEGGGHAFIVEVAGGFCRIYQSFFNAYAMARDMERNQRYGLEAFLTELAKAVAPGDASDSVRARRALFLSAAFHPDGDFRVTEFAPDPGVFTRLLLGFAGMVGGWLAILGNLASQYYALPPPVIQVPTGTVTVHFGDVGWRFTDPGIYSEVNARNLEVGKTYLAYYGGQHLLSVHVLAKDTGAETLRLQIE